MTMIIIRLELVVVILVKNVLIKSVFNPVKRVIGPASIGLSALVSCREFSVVPEVWTQIKRLRSIKKFVEKFQNNKDHVTACRESMQSEINKVEEELGRCRNSSNQIKILCLGTEEEA